MKIRLALLCLLVWLGCPASYAQAKPNYLFIAVDDLNDWIGVLGGHPQAKTPNIDRLAKRGVLFANAHTQAPLCNPSRASLLSGLRPSTTGLYTLQPGVRAVPALKNHVMLPQYLAQHGYATFSTGKIYHDGSIKPEVRTSEIQEWGTNGPPPYPDNKLIMPPVKADDRADVPELAWYLHWKLPEPRLSWLQANQQWRPLVRAYLATISFMDSQVGRVLDALEASGLANNTIIILWSDHGWHLGEKGISGKNTLWERSTRVPLIFAGPGIKAGGRSERPVELLDLYPTMIELSGMPARPELQGHSLVKQLRNPQAVRPWPAITTHNQNNHSVRSERWRYIRYADGSEELYDHRNDPNEWTNLAKDKRYARVIREHSRWLPTVNLPPVVGSAARLLMKENGVWMWEGKPIRAEEKEP
jgi:arylsulfatase A-like enzyme